MHNIWIIAKKELKRYFTDFRMIIGLFLPGVLIFVLYNAMGSIINNVESLPEEGIIYVENEPEALKNLLDGTPFTIKRSDTKLSKEAALDKLQNEEIDLYIIYEEDFMQKVQNYQVDSGEVAPAVQIYYKSASTKSEQLYTTYLDALNNYETSLSNKFDINKDQNINYDVTVTSDIFQELIATILPFLLLVLLFSSTMGICAESIAGEKERGTISTLLVTPIKRSELAFGKILAISITALSSSVVTFLGVITSIPKLMGGYASGVELYHPVTIILVLFVIMMTVLLFTTILTILSTFAKSVKEASSLAVPLMMIVLFVGLMNFGIDAHANNFVLYLIPIYNVVQSLTSLFNNTINPINFLLCIISNLGYVILGVMLLTKMFKNERIIFNH